MKKMTKKVLEQFPEVIFVGKRRDLGSEWFETYEDAGDCIEDDGPSIVAHYKLTGVYRLVKTSRTVDSISVKSK